MKKHSLMAGVHSSFELLASSIHTSIHNHKRASSFVTSNLCTFFIFQELLQ